LGGHGHTPRSIRGGGTHLSEIPKQTKKQTGQDEKNQKAPRGGGGEKKTETTAETKTLLTQLFFEEPTSEMGVGQNET